MKIGNINFESNIFLAPMAGITDLPFRLLCKEFGCGLVYSEMISAKGLHYNNKNTKQMLVVDSKERPIAFQLFGSDSNILSNIAKIVESYADIIDINIGCPAPKIVKNGEGAALMKEPKKIGEIVKAVSSAVNKPVTIKIRKGFDQNSLNALEIAKIAEENGAAAIAIHGRTREQYYSGNADWNIIKQIKENLKIPVIGNGDVDTPQKAKAMFEQTNCDAIMIGRAAQGNPWIFKQINHYLKTGELLCSPTLSEKIDMAIRHTSMLVDFKGEYIGIREMRKHIACYTKGLSNSSRLRKEINSVDSLNKMVELLIEAKKYTKKR